MQRTLPATVDITVAYFGKTLNKTVKIDLAEINDKGLAYIIEYGLTQSLNDSLAQPRADWMKQEAAPKENRGDWFKGLDESKKTKLQDLLESAWESRLANIKTGEFTRGASEKTDTKETWCFRIMRDNVKTLGIDTKGCKDVDGLKSILLEYTTKKNPEGAPQRMEAFYAKLHNHAIKLWEEREMTIAGLDDL